MPRIFDNINLKLLGIIQETLRTSHRADFCIGYFNLFGWQFIEEYIDQWSGDDGNQCRLMIGMQKLPEDIIKRYQFNNDDLEIDNAKAMSLKSKMAKSFADQLSKSYPDSKSKALLERLSRQLKDKKLVIKLYLKSYLHAKLYLLHRKDTNNPITAFLGSSNLTLSGLQGNGELNIDVMDHDATGKLQSWFDERWNDRFSLDISQDLITAINECGIYRDDITPYHIYLKIAYHLSEEAREGIDDFEIPKKLDSKLLNFQKTAVGIAAKHVLTRGGVIIGDVVGLGKTITATAVLKIISGPGQIPALIICPKNLISMWEFYKEEYDLNAKIISLSSVKKTLEVFMEDSRRYKFVLIDESHNLRNREGKRYQAIKDYIQFSESKVILLTATPYNKSFEDMGSQLRLFIDESAELETRPEKLIEEIGEHKIRNLNQCNPRTLPAFELSTYPEDWRGLLRFYLVRRTRDFIIKEYAKIDENGKPYLVFSDGEKHYFPERKPIRVEYQFKDNDPYAKLYSEKVIETITELKLPRYGLGKYVDQNQFISKTAEESKILDDLKKARQRLIGFCRTNLFKRLESEGYTFLLSIHRHILRNEIFAYAIENKLPLPIGTQDASLMDTQIQDQDFFDDTGDPDGYDTENEEDEKNENNQSDQTVNSKTLPKSFSTDLKSLRTKAKDIYDQYQAKSKKRFKWIASKFFLPDLKADLDRDTNQLLNIILESKNWDPLKDQQLISLIELITVKHPNPNEKILIFTQFSDTAKYLHEHISALIHNQVEVITGDTDNPTNIVKRFSPVSNKNEHLKDSENEIRVLICTDVISEGQNLQDCAIVINFDLPWAIIRLIQRAGRIDRIGQKSTEIKCYSFMPAQGVEKIINLRRRLIGRLKNNSEVIGSDETFFEGEDDHEILHDLYNEKSDVLNDHAADSENDLTSEAFQIWNNATKKNSELKKFIINLPSVVHATKKGNFDGFITYLKVDESNDILSLINKEGKIISQSPERILKLAECEPLTPNLKPTEYYEDIIKNFIIEFETEFSKNYLSLGRKTSLRYKTYYKLKDYNSRLNTTIFNKPELERLLKKLLDAPLTETARVRFSKALRDKKVTDEQFAELALELSSENRLCVETADQNEIHPEIICTLGLLKDG